MSYLSKVYLERCLYDNENVSNLVTGASNNGGEDSPGCIISCETGFAHSGSVVHDKSGGIFVTHCHKVGFFFTTEKKMRTVSTSTMSKQL